MQVQKSIFRNIFMLVFFLSSASATMAQFSDQKEYVLRAGDSRFAMDVQYAGTAGGNKIWLYDLILSPAQYFHILPAGNPQDHIYRVKAQCSGLLLTVNYSLLTSTAPQQAGISEDINYRILQDKLYTAPSSRFPSLTTKNSSNQLWKITSAADGSGRFLAESIRYPGFFLCASSIASGKSLTLARSSDVREKSWAIGDIPRKPSNVSVHDIAWKESSSRISGKLTWADNSNNETGFRVRVTRTNADGSTSPVSISPDITTANATSLSFTFGEEDSELGKNRQHCFTTEAINSSSAGVTAGPACKKADYNPPPAPDVKAGFSLHDRISCSASNDHTCTGAVKFRLSPVNLTGTTGLSAAFDITINNPGTTRHGQNTCCLYNYVHLGEGLKTGTWKLEYNLSGTLIPFCTLNLEAGLNNINICSDEGSLQCNRNMLGFPCD